jgi:hypothetical protein
MLSEFKASIVRTPVVKEHIESEVEGIMRDVKVKSLSQV